MKRCRHILCALVISFGSTLAHASSPWIVSLQAPASAQQSNAVTAISGAPVISEGRVVVMAIKGQISRKVLESIRGSISQVQGDPLPAGLIVLLDSPGGDGMAAMKIGQLLRTQQAHVFVTGQCASACIFVLASGVVRGAPAYSVGIHRGRITKSDANAKILEEVNIQSNPEARRLLEQFEKTAPVYFSQMGMPPELFQAMQSHQLKGVYRLSSEEVIFYGLNGFDPQYLDLRAEQLEKAKGLYRMDKD